MSNELASELDPDLKQTVDWGKKWLVDFTARRTKLVLYEQSNNIGAMMKKMLQFSFYFDLDWTSYIVSNTRTASKKVGVLICSINICK